ncbi:conserved hypothetical protein [Aspergillus fumigatus A1163]|uniref:Uncharacterized protein n=1 Tax=Aspergillus fumigatus (strain CBS 144.89 / FGSC A1163 / CEA10) TaxID=451804 RepID=B0Y4U5_ASPFC|nr:conserved hypothetical protein [Aspergillus fumigatus A1163]
MYSMDVFFCVILSSKISRAGAHVKRSYRLSLTLLYNILLHELSPSFITGIYKSIPINRRYNRRQTQKDDERSAQVQKSREQKPGEVKVEAKFNSSTSPLVLFTTSKLAVQSHILPLFVITIFGRRLKATQRTQERVTTSKRSGIGNLSWKRCQTVDE